MRKSPPAIASALVIALLLISPAYAKDKAPVADAATQAADTGEPAPLPKPWLYEGSDIPIDSSWTFGTLPNGLRYAVKRNEVPAGAVSVRVRIDAGTAYENEDEQGFAHLIEHLSFRGSTLVPDGEAKRIWQRFGVTFGSDSNAETTATQTVYKLDLPNALGMQGDATGLDQSLKIIAGMMEEPRINDASVNAERAIVLAELRENSGADLELGDTLRQHVFQGQRLGAHSINDQRTTLQSATAGALQAFHDRWYRPDNAVVVIAGDAEPAQLAQLVKKYFGEWKAEGAKAEQPDFGRPDPDAKATRVVVEPTLPTQVFLNYIRPWEKHSDTIAYNQQILIDQIALQIINRRLEEQARAGGSYSIAWVQQDNVSRSADTTSLSVTPIGDQWEKAVADVRGVVADALDTPPSIADITREQNIYADGIRTLNDSYPFESAAKQADSIVGAVDIRETVANPATVLQVFEASKPLMTPERILDATKRLFGGTATRMLLSTPKANPGDDAKLAAAFNATAVANNSARLSDKVASFDDLPKLGQPATVVATAQHRNPDMTEVRFSNGVRALLYPNTGETGQVRVRVRFGNGYQSKSASAGNLLWSGPLLLGDNGIAQLRKTQIDQMTNGRRIDMDFDVDNDAFQISADTRPQDLADQLRLIATKLEYPGWDPAPVERMKAVAIAGYNSFETSAGAVLQRELQYQLANKDARWKVPTPADVGKLNAATFEAYWKPLLAQGPVEVMLFGDFNQDEAIAAIEQSLGAMKPRPATPKSTGGQKLSFPAGNDKPVQFFHKGPADQAAAVMAWPTAGGLDNIVEGRHLEILAAIFRDRLFEKFRSEQAASYSPDMASSWPEEFSNGGYLMAYSQVKPGDVDSFFKFSNEVAADLAAKPVSADELQRAVEPVKQMVERAASGNMFWLSQLKGATYDPRRFEALKHLYKDYAQVTPTEIQALAKRYFVAGKAWKMVVEPGQKSGATSAN